MRHSVAHLLTQPSFTTDDTRAAHSTRRRSPRNPDKSSLDRRNKESNSRTDRLGIDLPLAADPGARISRPHNLPVSPAKTLVAPASSQSAPDLPAGSSVVSPAPARLGAPGSRSGPRFRPPRPRLLQSLRLSPTLLPLQ